MPHAALLVVQVTRSAASTASAVCFNAARGFVGGARPYQDWVPPKAPKFQCRSRLCWWCKSDIKDLTSEMMEVSMPLAALLVVQAGVTVCSIKSFPVSMPLAALVVVQGSGRTAPTRPRRVSMPLAALLVVQAAIAKSTRVLDLFQCRSRLCWWCKIVINHAPAIRGVSMPLAALLVVQEWVWIWWSVYTMFQCRSRLCWWCK